jgi:hypothetical protein
MNVNIHYDPATGYVRQIDNSEPHPETGEIMPSHDGVNVASIEMDATQFGSGVNPGKFKFDAATQSLVPHDPPPSREMIGCIVYSELCNTDGLMPHDRPMSDAKRAVWATYRQALRDLSKLPDAAAMLAAFPARPDDADPLFLIKG